jgi:hypothetical protein
LKTGWIRQTKKMNPWTRIRGLFVTICFVYSNKDSWGFVRFVKTGWIFWNSGFVDYNMNQTFLKVWRSGFVITIQYVSTGTQFPQPYRTYIYVYKILGKNLLSLLDWWPMKIPKMIQGKNAKNGKLTITPNCWKYFFQIYQDISTLLRLFEILQAQKSWQIKKSWSRNMIKLTSSWSWLRFAKNFRSWQISWSRLLWLEDGVVTSFWKLSRLRVSIETVLRQIETPKLTFATQSQSVCLTT